MGGMLIALEWNVNGLLQRRQELLFFDKQKIDVSVRAETHLTNQSYIKIKGYQVYHMVRPQNTATGGRAVLVKIHHEEVKYVMDKIQVTMVTVKTKWQAKTFAAVFCPPRYNLKKADYLNFLRSIGEIFMVGGDYKAKNTNWGSRLTTYKGKELYQE
jgi:exonuclease III